MQLFNNKRQPKDSSPSNNFTILSIKETRHIKRMFIELQPSSELVHVQFFASMEKGKNHICVQIDKWLAESSFKQFFIYYDLRDPLTFFSVISNPHSQRNSTKNSLLYREPNYDRFPFKLSNSQIAVKRLIDVYLIAASSHWFQMENMYSRLNMKQQIELIEPAKKSKNIFVKYLLQDYGNQTFQQDFSRLYCQFRKKIVESENQKSKKIEREQSSSSQSSEGQEVYILKNKNLIKQKLSKYKKIHHLVNHSKSDSKRKLNKQKVHRLISQKDNQNRVLEIIMKEHKFQEQ